MCSVRHSVWDAFVHIYISDRLFRTVRKSFFLFAFDSYFHSLRRTKSLLSYFFLIPFFSSVRSLLRLMHSFGVSSSTWVCDKFSIQQQNAMRQEESDGKIKLVQARVRIPCLCVCVWSGCCGVFVCASAPSAIFHNLVNPMLNSYTYWHTSNEYKLANLCSGNISLNGRHTVKEKWQNGNANIIPERWKSKQNN